MNTFRAHEPSTPDAARSRLTDFLAARVRSDARVLDAGCGRRLALDLGGRVTGLDVSEVALKLNDRLDERIVGDVQTHRLPRGHFDLVVCVDVLEHLPDPNAAVRNLLKALAPGGMLVLGFPNVGSPKGLVTKLTPFRFHVWAAKRVFGSQNAGLPGCGPFPTYMRVSTRVVRLIAREAGLTCLYHDAYESNWNRRARERNRVAKAVWKVVEAVYGVAGAGDPRATDLYVALRKGEEFLGTGGSKGKP